MILNKYGSGTIDEDGTERRLLRQMCVSMCDNVIDCISN